MFRRRSRRGTERGKPCFSRRDSFRLAAYLTGGLFLAGCSGGMTQDEQSLDAETKGKRETRFLIDGTEVTVSSICFQDQLVNPGDDPETGGSWSPEDPNQRFLLTLLMVESKADLEKLREWPRPGERNALAVTDEKGNRSDWSFGIPLEEETSGFEEEAGRPGVFFVFLVDRIVAGLNLHFPDGSALNLSTIPYSECWFEG